jgi:hypothetical protein
VSSHLLTSVLMTTGISTIDIESQLHAGTQLPTAASDLVTRPLQAIKEPFRVSGEVVDGDVQQMPAVTSATRGRMIDVAPDQVAGLHHATLDRAGSAASRTNGYAAARA